MDNQKTLLYISLFFLMFLLYQNWQKMYGPQPPQATVAETPANQNTKPHPDQMTTPPVNDAPEMPQAPEAASTPAAPQPVSRGQKIDVKTDLLDITIDTQGGTIVEADLLDYPESPEDKQPFRLMSVSDKAYYVAQSGLLSSKDPAPNHHALYQAEASSYSLQPGQDQLQVKLHWQDKGVRVTKVLTFHRNSYVVDVDHIVQPSNDWSGIQYRQLNRSESDGRTANKFIHTYTGGVVYDATIHYEKISFSDMAKKNAHLTMTGGWIAMIQHYFMSAWIPAQDEENQAYTRHPQADRYVLGISSGKKTIAAGQQGEFKTRLVLGPKLQERLKLIAPGLEKTVDYGKLTILAEPLYWLLEKYHSLFGNWGWAIIFLTLTVKLVFYKLSETSYRSMARMRKMAPKMQALKERYGDDKQKMSQAMMKMYKEEKINPLGGCLPVLVQIPVFIALYWVLLETVEMRNAPFMLWITNLSAKDPYYVLPVIMGISMFVQQKLNPAPMDPMQQKIFQIMPFAFTFFFLFFPSGLVLYWVVNNILSITQQYIITRRIQASG